MTSSRRLVQSLATRANHVSLVSRSSRTRYFISPSSTTRPNPSPLLSSQFCRYSPTSIRTHSSLTDSKPVTPEDAAQNARRRAEERAFQITFTCKPCGHRSSHRISQHGYYKGTVLISCPGCRNRHVISDHLNIFMDKKSTLEDILSEHGQTLLKGKLDGDVEWWEDGTVRAVAGASEREVQGQMGQTAQQQQNAGIPREQEQTKEQADEIKQPGHSGQP
ncbi:DNL zinc finger domain-containing protein [Histoplasma capsulatum]|uniref:DNL zinc finger domain-containing protein n=1 Tax=Ajellomyces capsulatus TaxID=5037 RepID=A0A8A1MNB8_AJECA|nr:DNL zinc finger domain-containing protein [Histoplasma capsulatum]